MKVTDNEILDVIWEEQLLNIAARTLVSFQGNKIAVENFAKDVPTYTSYVTIESIKPALFLSASQLRIRIKQLVNKEKLKGDVSRGGGTIMQFYIAAPCLEAVIQKAIDCWKVLGVPCGIENGRFNTIPRESIDVLTAGETIHRILCSEFPFESLYQQE